MTVVNVLAKPTTVAAVSGSRATAAKNSSGAALPSTPRRS